jgi:hypothetical protein
MEHDLIIYYRTSDAGYPKDKPDYVNNFSCLYNFLKEFPYTRTNIIVMADNVSDETKEKLEKEASGIHIDYTSIGSSAGTFQNVFLDSLNFDDDAIIYFVENDYIHAPNAMKALLDGFNIGANYVTLYDHPDKYLQEYDYGESTRVMQGDVCHWKMTISTTMTFAAKVKTLRDDSEIWTENTTGSYPTDHRAFTQLREKGRILVSPIPGYSTHGETAWLSPFRNWGEII